MSERDNNLMQRAFAEAAKSDWLFTAPNPLVGALALHSGHVVGYGHHARFGQEHAEEMALSQAAQADELYVTLEPCSSTGSGKKRSACTDVILQSNVKRVVIGALDPDSRHAGRGIELLRSSGIEVDVLECGQQFSNQNPAFIQHLQRQVPFTIVKWASTVDGFTASSSRKSQWISNPLSRAEVHSLRGASQAIVSAAGTVVADNPHLTARGVKQNILQTKVLIGCASKVQEDAVLFADDMQRLWFDAVDAKHKWADAELDKFHCCNSEQQVDLAEVFSILRTKYKINRAFVEGGSRLFQSLLKHDLVHAVVKYEAPLLLAGGMPIVAGDGFDSPQQSLKLSHELRCDHGSDLRRAWLVN